MIVSLWLSRALIAPAMASLKLCVQRLDGGHSYDTITTRYSQVTDNIDDAALVACRMTLILSVRRVMGQYAGGKC